MGIYGELYGALWGIMGFCGVLWDFMGFYGELSGTMGNYGVLWGIMGFCGVLWDFMGFYGELSGTMGNYGVLWGIMEKHPDACATQVGKTFIHMASCQMATGGGTTPFITKLKRPK